jgi:hypothetical protein
LTWTTSGTYAYAGYKYISIVVNAYEGCLVSLAFYRKYTLADVFTNVQVVRSTFSIKTRVNYVKGLSTEYQSLNTYSYISTVATGIIEPCRVYNKYYWHPYNKIYFYLDKPTTKNQIVFTCIPYNAAPTTACGYDFNSAVAPTFKAVDLTVDTGTGVISSVTEVVTFTRSTAYMAVQYFVSGLNYNHRIYKLTITGTDCTNYAASLATQVYTGGNEVLANDINNLVVIP